MVIEMGDEFALIQISVKTREQLKAMGKTGETYDKIIQRLIRKG